MRFPPEFIERLRNHLPLSEVIGVRVPLRRAGREFQGLCPFHKEKSPSFTVNDEKGFFHCFGCGAHGDSIGFIKDFEGVSYPEAVERLAGEAGLALPAPTREAEAAERQRHSLEDVMALAAGWYQRQIQQASGREARDYLRDRGILPETIERFGLGFAPNSRDALRTALLSDGIPEALLKEAGLVANSDNGGAYDRFRGRLIFPIRSAQGKTVAFGGRILPSATTDRTAKYLNSPETPLFKKGELLYAYDIARKNLRDGKQIILAEGYLDVIALHQSGFATAVAPLGTAVTESQIRLLWRASPRPIFCLDGDTAGQRAMQRAADVALPLLKPETGLAFATLPRGDDPDSLIRTRGPAAMQHILDRAIVLSQMIWNTSLTRFGSETPEQKASLEHYLTQAADRIQDAIVKRQMHQYFRNQIYSLSGRKDKGKSKPKAQVFDPIPEIGDESSQIRRMEEQITVIILLHPALLHEGDVEERFAHLDLTQPILDKLRSVILEVSAEMQSLDSSRLCAELSVRGYSEKVETILHSETSALSASSRALLIEHSSAAAAAFEQVSAAFSLKKLEQEALAASLLMEREMSEQNYQHFLALQKQIEEMRRARFAHAPGDAVS